MAHRSRKMHTLLKSMKPPTINGDDSGDLLVVTWGSTRGSVEEAVGRLRADGKKVSSINLVFLSPLEPGLTEIFSRFKKVMTVEINYSDELHDEGFVAEYRRHAQLATMLRAQTLVDVDSWSKVPGTSLPPGVVVDAINDRLASI